MKRKRLRKRSKKYITRAKEAKPFRDALKLRVRRCELCARTVGARHARLFLQCHEIAGGHLRQIMLDKAFGILVLCNSCHREVQVWPHVKQLALLQARRPKDYDLKAFNEIVYPCASGIAQEDVDAEVIIIVR